MAQFKVTAVVTVDLEMIVSAENAEQAKTIFDNNICMTANLVDVSADDFTVMEDGIDDIDRVRVEPYN
jgi:hypothetical protein